MQTPMSSGVVCVRLLDGNREHGGKLACKAGEEASGHDRGKQFEDRGLLASVATNVVTLITKDGIKELPLMGKDEVAGCLLDEIAARR